MQYWQDYSMFKIEEGMPLIDPYKTVDMKISSNRVLLVFTTRLFKIAAGMLQESGRLLLFFTILIVIPLPRNLS